MRTSSDNDPKRDISDATATGQEGSIGLLGREFREKFFDRQPIFFSSIWVLILSQRRGSMDAPNLRDKLSFFGRGRDIEN